MYAPAWVAAGLAVGVLGCPATELKTEDQADREGASERQGVVVVEVDEGSVLANAGLHPGDVIFDWERLPNPPANPEAERGEIDSVFTWMWLEVEQSPRATVRLFGEREGMERVFEVPMGRWDGKVRPRLPARVLEAYLRGQERELARQGEAEIDRRSRSWIQLRIGEESVEEGALERALEAYLAALEDADAPTAEVAIWDRIGRVFERRHEPDQAEASYRSALEIAEATWGKSLHTAKMKHRLGGVAWHRGQLELAWDHGRDALEIREELAPDSLDLALSLNNLGVVAHQRGQLELASENHRRALEIREKLAPDSLDLAMSLNNLGNVAYGRGQLELANEYHQRALEIREELAPESLSLAASLNNLGNVAYDRHQLELASEYYERALEIWEKLAPDSLDLAMGLNNLGGVALKRDRLELASEYYQRALEIKEKLAPGSLRVALSLNNLGNVAYDRGELELAGEYYQRALEIKEKLAPGSLDLASSLNNQGIVAYGRGALELASEYQRRALEIQEKLAPESLGLARSLNYLGEATRARGDMDRAADLFQRAIHTLEAQISNLGSSHDVKASFRAQYSAYYRNVIETLLQLHRPDDAFATLESSRARAFLALLAERDLIFSDVPEELDRERRRLGFVYESTQKQIGDLNPRDHADEIDRLTGQLRDLRRRQNDNADRIRRASPKFAALRYPEPLDLEGVRQALDPGTVMLAYSIGEKQTHLFILTRESPLEVHALDVGEELLDERLGSFANRVHGKNWKRIARSRFEMARWLYRQLIEPAETAIDESERLLIVPEGPLYRLPFAALIRDGTGPDREGTDERTWQYLVEWKPLHTVLSGTVYAELRRLRRSPARSGIALAAFGDPVYPTPRTQGGEVGGAASADVYVSDATDRFHLYPLPHTRTEVQAVAGLFGAEPVRIYLGQDATEEHAKALAKDVRIVHFATHGLLDDSFPLNSSLALSLPADLSEGSENGLLQAWEIFERVRLDADLVVLSACRTATGEEQFGEGLIGLSRAFQYAGARSVLATLWNVADRATADLMSRFYRHLRAGKNTDEALRSAQEELIRGEVKTERGEVASAPYYWAAFQIIGDWR